MRFRRRAVILTAALLGAGGLAPAAAHATSPTGDLYVRSTACSNSGPGTADQPFCTIQAAADVVDPGQTVVIEPGSYPDPVVLTRSGTADSPITFRTASYFTGFGLNPRYALDPAATSSTVPFTLSAVQHVRISGITIEHGQGDGLRVSGSSDIVLDRIGTVQQGAGTTPVTASDGVVVDGTSSDVSVTRSWITGNHGYGVRIEPGAHQVTLAADVFANDQTADVLADGVSGLAVTGNSVHAAGCAPALSLQGATTATVENNAAWSTPPAGTPACAPEPLVAVAPETTGSVTLAYNAWSAPAPRFDYAWGGTDYATAADLTAAVPGQGSHDLDLAAGDMGLTPPEGSARIDSGDSAAPGAAATDYLGNGPADDPKTPNTGAGSGIRDRGAVEREDTVGLTSTLNPASALGAAPFSMSVHAQTTDTWNETVTSTVDFGDGSGPQPTSGGSATHVYTTPGHYTVTTVATDADGYSVSRTNTASVATPAAPAVTLNASAGPDSPTATLIVEDSANFAVQPAVADDAWELSSAQLYPGDGTSEPMSLNSRTGYDYSHPGTYTAKVVVTDVLGRTSTSTATVTVGDEFAPRPPMRDYDSRTHGIDSVPAHGTVHLSLQQLDANFGNVDGVGLNVTVTDAKAAGYLTVYPYGGTRPNASTLNFAPGQTVTNSLIAMAGGNGSIAFYNGSGRAIDLIVDSFGIESGMSAAGGGIYDTYSSVGPLRVLDTRNGTGAARAPVAARHAVTLQVAGRNGIPSDATAVVLNVATTDTKAPGYLAAYGDGNNGNPGISNSNWAARQTVSNQVVVPLFNGKVVFYNGSGGTVDFVADLVGYYHNLGTAAVIVPTTPTRVLDTRTGRGTGGAVAKLGAHQSVTLKLAGLPVSPTGIPTTGAIAAELNLTVTNTTAGGYLTAYPADGSRPTASSLNFTRGGTTANSASTPIGPDGSVTFYNGSSGPLDLVVDLSGFYYSYSS